MKCQCCKASATIHITEIHDGQRVETHLCEQCAQKQGVAVKSQIPLNELLTTLLSSKKGNQIDTISEDSASNHSCPECQMSYNDFRKEGLLGCPNDYEAFGDQIKAVIESAQSQNDTHKGKVPKSAPEKTKKQVEINKLQQELDKAVKEEKYELAAELRDKLAKLENEAQ